MLHLKSIGWTRVPLTLLTGAWRAVRHRRQANSLHGLTDAQLKDIGLTRDDVRRAYRQPLFTDPTILLSAWALEKSLGRFVTGRKTDGPRTITPVPMAPASRKPDPRTITKAAA